MAKVDWDDSKLNEAIILWTGYGQSETPSWNDAYVLKHFGKEGERLLKLIEFIADEFYKSDANYIASDVSEMHRIAISDFKKKYPKASDHLLNALAWCYTFDNR